MGFCATAQCHARSRVSATPPSKPMPTDFTFGATIPGYTYALTETTLQLTATASTIPEPSTYAAIFGAAALALACYRRRQKARG